MNYPNRHAPDDRARQAISPLDRMVEFCVIVYRLHWLLPFMRRRYPAAPKPWARCHCGALADMHGIADWFMPCEYAGHRTCERGNPGDMFYADACKALEKHKQRADKAEAALREVQQENADREQHMDAMGEQIAGLEFDTVQSLRRERDEARTKLAKLQADTEANYAAIAAKQQRDTAVLDAYRNAMRDVRRILADFGITNPPPRLAAVLEGLDT